METTLKRRQTRVHEALRGLSLPAFRETAQAGIPSPYLIPLLREEASAGRANTLPYMKAIYIGLLNPNSVNSTISFEALYDDNGTFSTAGGEIDISTASSYEDMRDLISAAVVASAPASMSDADIIWPPLSSALVALSNAPQAAIADAPADATTNYNVVTTLLGTLVGAVNTANAKQNDIATKLNTLLAELRTLGLISA